MNIFIPVCSKINIEKILLLAGGCFFDPRKETKNCLHFEFTTYTNIQEMHK